MEAFSFSKLEALQTFWIFMEASLQRHYWSNHRPLAVDSTSSSLPQPGSQGVGLKVPSLFPWLVSLTTSPHSLGTFQNCLMNINPGVLEWGCIMNTETPISPGSEAISGSEDKGQYCNKRYSHCICGSGNSKALGSYEPGTIDMKTIYVENIFCSSEQADTCSL